MRNFYFPALLCLNVFYLFTLYKCGECSFLIFEGRTVGDLSRREFYLLLHQSNEEKDPPQDKSYAADGCDGAQPADI